MAVTKAQHKRSFAHVYRLYPNTEQIDALSASFAYRRRAWNFMHDRIGTYMKQRDAEVKAMREVDADYKPDTKAMIEEMGKMMKQAQKDFRKVKYEPENAWMKALCINIPEYAFLRYNAAWNGKNGFFGKLKNGVVKQKRAQYLERRKATGLPVNPEKLDAICKPKFQSAKDPEQSFQVKGSDVDVHAESGERWGYLAFKGIPGALKFRQHRDLVYDHVSTVTIRRTTIGEYYVAFSLEEQDVLLPQPPEAEGEVLALDSNALGFFGSDGVFHLHPLPGRKYADQKAFLQKRLKKKQKDSKRYQKWRLRLAKLEKRISRTRENWLHHLSHMLATRSDITTIVIEELDLEAMAAKPLPIRREDGHFLPNGAEQTAAINRAMRDVGHYGFLQMLKYKCEWHGKKLVVVKSLEKTNRTCSSCGHDNTHVHYRMSVWTCTNCGTVHGKYKNSAELLVNKAKEL